MNGRAITDHVAPRERRLVAVQEWTTLGAKQPNDAGIVCFCDTGELYEVEVDARVLRAVQAEGMSVRQAVREVGLSRKTIR